MSNVFGTRQNNDGDTQKNITTKVYQFKNKTGFEPSTLQVSGWNEMFSIRINPALPENKQTKEQIFDYDKFVATSLNMEKATALLYKIEKSIKPAIENDEEKNVGVNIAGTSLVTIGTGKKITGEIRPYIAIHKELDPDTKKAGQSIYYEFKTIISVDDYDSETGEYSIDNSVQGEFELFCDLLKSFIINNNFIHHVNKNCGKYYNDKIVSTINAIAEKLGIETKPSYYSSYKNKQSIFNQENSYSDDINNIEEVSDLDGLLN